MYEWDAVVNVATQAMWRYYATAGMLNSAAATSAVQSLQANSVYWYATPREWQCA